MLAFTQPNHTWNFSPDTIESYNIQNATFADLTVGGGLIFDGKTNPIELTDKSILPTQSFSVSAWISIDSPSRWGGIIGCVQDNGDTEFGWVLGYNESQFTIGLSTEGSDDGNGKMDYLDSGDFTYEIGKWNYVVATYDGETLKIFVNGNLCNETTTQHDPRELGKIKLSSETQSGVAVTVVCKFSFKNNL